MTATRTSPRLDYLDATRAFALGLGVVFHASLSFLPVFIGWAVQDVSTSPWVSGFVTISHSFRMVTFFLLAGFLGRLTFHRRGWVDFGRSRLVRLGVPFVAGWFVLRPLLVAGWIMGGASLRGDYAVGPAVQAGFGSLRGLPDGLFLQTHLWFLYYLGLITGLTLIGRLLAGRWAPLADGAVATVMRSRGALVALALPTAVLVGQMRSWGVDTPDQSLWPEGPVLLLYGGCFAGGWLLGRQPALLTELGTLSVARGLTAVVSAAVVLMLAPLQMDPGHPYQVLAHGVHSGAYALMIWSLVGLTLGVFRRWFQQPRAWVRYVADSSYWMYLIHLPIVVWLQVVVAEWPWHWSFKLGFVSAVTIAVALVTYDLFVRSTWVGLILNGRRRDRLLGRRRRTPATTWSPETPSPHRTSV